MRLSVLLDYDLEVVDGPSERELLPLLVVLEAVAEVTPLAVSRQFVTTLDC
jgi:hypothetical protein